MYPVWNGGELFPRSSERGPIEGDYKRHDPPLPPAFPRSSERGPIEGHHLQRHFADIRRFPRSSERGPIEGDYKRHDPPLFPSFPRSSERGPIEGVKSPAFLYRVLKFPRSSERGPIEGPTRSVSCNSAISHFRAHLSAAPLKANANRAAILRRGFISALI